MLRPSILGDFGVPFMCIALTGDDSGFLIFAVTTSNIPTVSTLLLLTHKTSLLTKAVRMFVMSEHQLSTVYFNLFITNRCQTDSWNRICHCKNTEGYSKRQRGELGYTGHWNRTFRENLAIGTVWQDLNLKEEEEEEEEKGWLRWWWQ